MNDRLFPTRPILAVSAAVFRDGRALIIRRARRRCWAISVCRAAGSRSARHSPPRSLGSLWKRSESKPKSSLLTAMWRRFSTKGPNTNAFCHRFVRRALDARRAAPERRGRRGRMDRSRRPPALADDAGTGRGSRARGADRSTERLRRQRLSDGYVIPRKRESSAPRDGCRFRGHDREGRAAPGLPSAPTASTRISSIPISTLSPVPKLARSVHWRFLRPCSRTPSGGLSSSDLGA